MNGFMPERLMLFSSSCSFFVFLCLFATFIIYPFCDKIKSVKKYGKRDIMQNVGQIVGFAAMAVSMLIYLQRKRKNILILKLSSDVLWALHHLMILSYTAALTTAIAIFREIVFYNYDKKWAKSRWWSVGFSLVFVMAALFTWKRIDRMIINR